MTQKSQIEVIDTFSDTLAQLAPPETRAALRSRLSAATGDLLESVNSISTNNTAHQLLKMLVAFGVLSAGQAADHVHILGLQTDQDATTAHLDALDARTDRRASPRDDTSATTT